MFLVHSGVSIVYGKDVVLASRWSRVRLPAAATNTGMSGRLRASKLPQYFTKLHRPTQPPTLSQTGKEYQPRSDDARGWGAKDERQRDLREQRQVWFFPLVDKRVDGR